MEFGVKERMEARDESVQGIGPLRNQEMSSHGGRRHKECTAFGHQSKPRCAS